MPKGIAHFFEQFNYASLAENALRVGLVLIGAIVLYMGIRFALSRFESRIIKRMVARCGSADESRKRAQTLTALLRRLVAILYWFAVLLTLLSQIGVNIGALLAGAGVAGLALSFGAQSLVRDVISGFFIVLENQIRVGDIATINSQSGTVEAINFRTTIMRDLDGAVHVFRNGDINQIANLTRDWSGYTFNLGVAYKEDTDRVIELIRHVAGEMRQDPDLGAGILEDVEIFGVNELGDSAVVVKGRIKTRPGLQWSTGRAFLARVKKVFDAEGIEIPFPHRTLYFGEASKPFLVSNPDPAANEAGGN